MLRLFNLLMIVTLCCSWALVATAQRDDYDYMKAEGYFDFGDVSEYADGEEMVEIELTQPLLGLFSGIVDSDDPELGEVLESLQLVNVRVFSVRSRMEKEVIERMTTLSGELKDANWESIVRVRGDEENINVFIKMSNAEKGKPANPDTAIEGLVVLVLDDYEAAFVNIVGKFGMEEINRLGQHFNIPHSDDWDNDDEWRSRRRRSRDDDDDDN